MRASSSIIATGAELLSGAVEDRNGPWLARALASLGFPAGAILLVGDDEAAVASGLEDAAARGDSVAVVTGGLGPTVDDVTRHAIARFAGIPLVEDPGLCEKLSAAFARRGKTRATGDLRQALLPLGSTVIPNPAGTADGFFVNARGLRIVALPGPPHEMAATAGEDCAALQAAMPPGAVRSESVRLETFGLREAEVDALLDDVRATGVMVGTLASNGCTSVVITSSGPAARGAVEAAARIAMDKLGLNVFGRDGSKLERVVADELMRKGVTAATAESCTGGMVGQLLTSVPGVSQVYLEGVIPYSNEAKTRLLGVDPCLIAEKGAVSAEVALAMAQGVCLASGARLGISTTGIAGPGGGTPEKPVGTVFVAVCLDGEMKARKLTLPSMGRDWVRRISAMSALDLARRTLLQNNAQGPQPKNASGPNT